VKTTIYYFTGTGNSLAFAKKLAEELGDTDLISIPQAMRNGELKAASEKIGFIFPVYAWGPPRMVEEFIEASDLSAVQYFFGIATCAAVPGGSLGMIAKLLKKKNKTLDSGFVIREPRSSLQKDEGPVLIMYRIADRSKYRSGKERLEEIAGIISRGEKRKYEANDLIPRTFGNFMHGPASNMFKEMDNEFQIDENCVSCKTCMKICPRGNISFENDKPKWNNDCEQCMACIQWCPKSSIQIDDHTVEMERYHHPDVSLKDVIIT
jgi:ferredoxin